MSRFRIPLPLKIAAGALLMVFVISRVDFSAALAAAVGANPWLLLLSLAVAAGSWVLNSYKWQLLLAADEASADLGYLTRLSFIAVFYNMLLPGQVGGEVVKGINLARSGVPGTIAGKSIVADRLTGMLALLALGVGGAIMAPGSLGRLDLLPWLIGFAVLLAGMTALLVGGWGAGRVVALGSSLGLSPNILSGLQARRGGLGAMALPLLLSLAFQGLTVYANLLICQALGIEIGFPQLLWTVALVSLLQALPISIAGIGVREGALVYLLQMQGIAAPRALAFSLLIFAIQIVLALIGGLLQLQKAP